MGYNLVPRSAAAGDGAEEGGSEMSMSHPGMLEALAERDVEHQLAELTMSPTAKRLEQQVRVCLYLRCACAFAAHSERVCVGEHKLKALEFKPVFTSVRATIIGY